jgi:hypothetical protein
MPGVGPEDVMNTFGLVLLSVIALLSFAQVLLLLAVVRTSRRVLERAAALEDEYRREIRPQLDKLAHVTENAVRITDAAVRQLPGVEAALDQAAGTVRKSADIVEWLVLRPLSAVAAGVALLSSVRRLLRGPAQASRPQLR